MVHYISNVPIASIEELSLSSASGDEEIDIINQDSNVVFETFNEAQEVEISFILSEQAHPNNEPIEIQREEVKQLPENASEDNYFTFDNVVQGFIAVDNVSLAEDASVDTIREGTLSGTLLPWPKFYENGRIGNNKIVVGEDILLSFESDGDIDLLQSAVGSLDSTLSLSSPMEKGRSIDGGLAIDLAVSPNGDLLVSSVGEISSALDLTAYAGFNATSGDYGIGAYGSGKYNS